MPSPYFVNVDPSPAKLRMFFGRRQEIQAIAHYLLNGDSVMLIGERRMGKTFLLYMLRDLAQRDGAFYMQFLDRETGALLAELQAASSSCLWSYVDMLHITSAEGFYFHLLTGLAEEQSKRFADMWPIDHATFAKEIVTLSEDLLSRGQRAFLLVDESEKLLMLKESAQVLSCLKAAIQQSQGVELVLAGDIKPHQTTPDLTNLRGALRTIYLAPLEPAAAKGLVQIPVEPQLSFEEQALDTMLELSGSKPGLLQILCDHLYELLVPQDVGPVQVTTAELEQLWESKLRGKVFESFDVALRDFFEGLQGDERDVFRFLAHNPLATIDDIVESLDIDLALARRALYTLHGTHRIEQMDSDFRISARIVEEFGSRFVPCPAPKTIAPMPIRIAPVAKYETTKSGLVTNLKHHAEEIATLAEQWVGVKTQEEIEAWLLMFEDEERDIAIKLLTNTRYYSQEEIYKWLKILHGKFMRAVGCGLKPIWFLGMGGASKSGQMLSYHYRTVNRIGQSRFQDPRLLPSFASQGIRVLAFIDDFVGSGNQATKYWHEELEGQYGIDRADLYCLVLFAFQSAIEHIQAQTPFRVICVEMLDERDRVFSPACTVFDSDEERKRAEEICLRHGRIICPNFPLGYDDSQALIAFEYQTPNNSLPILWSNAKGWFPIFERKS